jgi:hypothetical protein
MFNFDYEDFELGGMFDDFDTMSIDEKLGDVPNVFSARDLALLNRLHQASRPRTVGKKLPPRFRVKHASTLVRHGFVRVANSPNKLVRLSEKDFWEIEDKDGELIVKRLFDPNAGPVKA